MPNHHTTPSRAGRAIVASLLVFLALLGVACSDDGGEESSDVQTQSTSGSADATKMTIWAPTNLQTTIDKIVKRFQQRQPDKQIEVSYGAVTEFQDRLLSGERPDLYVDTSRQINTLVQEGSLPDSVTRLGSDEMQIVVAPGNPKRITDLTVFGLDPTTNVGLCANDASCGRIARSALASAQVNAAADSIEPDGPTLLSKIVNGQLDAGLLLRTQTAKAVRNGTVTAVALPSGNRAETEFQMVAVRTGGVVDELLRYIRRSKGAAEVLEYTGLAAPAGTTTTTQQP